MEAVIIMCIGEIVQGLSFAQNAVFGSAVQEHAQINVACEALQLGVQFQNTIH